MEGTFKTEKVTEEVKTEKVTEEVKTEKVTEEVDPDESVFEKVRVRKLRVEKLIIGRIKFDKPHDSSNSEDDSLSNDIYSEFIEALSGKKDSSSIEQLREEHLSLFKTNHVIQPKTEPKKEESISQSKTELRKEDIIQSKTEPKKEESISQSKTELRKEVSVSCPKIEPRKEESISQSKIEFRKEVPVSCPKIEPRKEESISQSKIEFRKEVQPNQLKTEPKKEVPLSESKIELRKEVPLNINSPDEVLLELTKAIHTNKDERTVNDLKERYAFLVKYAPVEKIKSEVFNFPIIEKLTARERRGQLKSIGTNLGMVQRQIWAESAKFNRKDENKLRDLRSEYRDLQMSLYAPV